MTLLFTQSIMEEINLKNYSWQNLIASGTVNAKDLLILFCNAY